MDVASRSFLLGENSKRVRGLGEGGSTVGPGRTLAIPKAVENEVEKSVEQVVPKGPQMDPKSC